MCRDEIVEKLQGLDAEETPLADGFEDAFLGVGYQFNRLLAVYDRRKCIQILMRRDNMSENDAEEFFEFNVIGAYAGEHTPVFLELN